MPKHYRKMSDLKKGAKTYDDEMRVISAPVIMKEKDIFEKLTVSNKSINDKVKRKKKISKVKGKVSTKK